MTTDSTQPNSYAADVIIIGGGLAGLTCAVGLRESGLKTLVLESSELLGGRASSWTDSVTGDTIHIGPHIFLNAYKNMFKLMDMLGTRSRIIWQPGGVFITMVDGQQQTVMKRSPLPSPFHFVPSLFSDTKTSVVDRLSNVPLTAFALQATEEELLKLDHLRASDFVRQMGVTKNYIDWFWEFMCISLMNVTLDQCSTTALIRIYRHLVGQKDLSIGFADRGLSDLFTRQAQRLIEGHRGEVLVNTPVKSILGDTHRATGVLLEDGRELHARYVVAAVPPTVLRRIIPALWAQRYEPFRALKHFEPCAYYSPYLWFDRKLTTQQFWARSYRAGDYNTDFYDLSNINYGWEKRNSVITSNIINTRRFAPMTDEEIIGHTVAELSEFLPAAKDAKLLHARVNRIPMAIHCPTPGTERLRPTPRTPVASFFLAGDWVKTDYPSSMEGACRAGWLAAEEIWRILGKEQNLAEEPDAIDPSAWLTGQTWNFLPTMRIPQLINTSNLFQRFRSQT